MKKIRTITAISFFMVALFSCSKASTFEEPKTATTFAQTEKDGMVWEDLRIQTLLPGYLELPAIEPCLPASFVAMDDPKDCNKICWGDKNVLETFFKTGHLKSAFIRVNISPNVAQIDENSFSGEGLDSDPTSQLVKNRVTKKWKWGAHLVMSLDATIMDKEANMAWIGLNKNGIVLFAALIYPPNQTAPSTEDLKLWSNFLQNTKPLAGNEFFKAYGQDLKEGFTLVNVSGSILKVSAEKRIRDEKIQISIQSKNQTASCNCFAVGYIPISANSPIPGPILKIKLEIQVNKGTNITSYQMITIFPKEVSEFSTHKNDQNHNTFSYNEYGNISVFNFCEKDVITK